jgi:hypothetical protein
MHMPFSGSSNGSARHYVERIGSLYARAKALIGLRSHERGLLQNWQWHRASAQACQDEAVLIYLEGLEALLRLPVSVRLNGEARAPVFVCEVKADTKLAFSLDAAARPAAALENADARGAVEALFGEADREVLEAFAEGLYQLQRLGEFDRSGRIKLTPALDAAAADAITAPDGL